MPYHDFWSLHTAPFGASDLGRRYYAAKPQREAFARIQYLVDNGHSVGLLIGNSGCGKSELLKQVATSRGFGDHAIDVALTSCGQRTTVETLEHLAVQLGIGSDVTGWRSIRERILAAARQHVRTVWLIDDASVDVAAAAASLVSQERWLTVVAAVQPERVLKVATALDVCPLRVDLTAFTLRDTMSFVRQRLSEAGGREDIFTDGALIRMHELSDGRIAVIVRIAELAMAAAAANQQAEINAGWIDAVQDEFVRAA